MSGTGTGTGTGYEVTTEEHGVSATDPEYCLAGKVSVDFGHFLHQATGIATHSTVST